MRTLFLRIFLSFWAAMGLILAGAVLVTATVTWYRMGKLENVDVRELTQQAAEEFEQGGLDAVRRWINESERLHVGQRIYVIDSEGKEVLGRSLPDLFRNYVGRLERAGLLSDAEQAKLRAEDPLLITPQFVDTQGNVYTVMLSNSARGQLAALGYVESSFLLMAFALGLAVSGLVCWWLARYVSKPVERLQASARSLAAGNLEARTGEDFSRRRDELGVLARDFDTMADHLRALIASKEELLRDMSHELRSPLARMRVALGLARRQGSDVTRQLDRIELEAERLDTLIGQMLQLSHLRAVEPALPREPVDLGALLGEVVEDARLEASAAGKSVEWTLRTNVCVHCDYDLMRSAIENVLRNAVRFTLPGTAVHVTLDYEYGSGVVTIRDYGPGVSEADLARIFEPFYRVAASRDRDSGGTGLGLAITARILRMYGGSVSARNMQGGGLQVEIRLPAIKFDAITAA